MRGRYPERWLMTDERLGNDLWRALRRLPPGSGIVFRHHATPPAERRALFTRIRRIAHARHLMLVAAGSSRAGPRQAGSPRATSRHDDPRHASPHHDDPRQPNLHHAGIPRHGRVPHAYSWPAHTRAEAAAGQRAGATLLFVSPVFATRSHPGAPPLGITAAARIGRTTRLPMIALGGMTEKRWQQIRRHGFTGWAAIDAWRHSSPARGGGSPQG